MRSNFQVNRLYTSNDISYYKCGSAKASKREKVSFPVAVRRFCLSSLMTDERGGGGGGVCIQNPSFIVNGH